MSENKILKTLAESEIVSESNVGRRSALRWIGASVAGLAVAAVVSAPRQARAQGVSDSDGTDAAGHGRTGITDRDAAPGADGPNHGVCPGQGHSDADHSDPAGRGRGPCH